MAQYVAPVRGGAICECCGVLVAAYRVMPPQGGCRVRFHRCVCGWMGKSVEKLEVVEYWHHEAVDPPAADVPHGQLTVDSEEKI